MIVTAEHIAQSIVALYDAADDKPCEFKAAIGTSVMEAAAERLDVGVIVVPFSETETPEDRGDMVRDEIEVQVVVNGPLGETGFTRDLGLSLSKFLRHLHRETEIEGYDWDSCESISLYDVEAERKHQFLALYRVKYYSFI